MELRQIKLNTNKSYKIRLYVIFSVILFIVVSFSVFFTIKKIADWFNDNEVIFNKVINIDVQKPISIKKREKTINIVEVAQVVDNLPKAQTPIEQYICDKWGVTECKLAIAVARAEGLKYDKEGNVIPDAYNVNKNGTFDLGVFQINSVHFKKDMCHLKDMVDPYKNVDCAYEIYQDSGWNAWSAFKNGSYAQYLKEVKFN